MYNKIASIILNSAKATGLSDVFVAQPDAVKESLAGKIFLLAEIGGKKSEGRKIFDFLIMALTDNYYNDEKILFRDKIEGLKLENIFEAAIAKTNKDLIDFLGDEKIRINPETTSITLGVIYENKLHFANFGRNRALLIYRHGENYELINVEANAADADTAAGDDGVAKTPQLFSSVISGEVPVGSYFIFASEALPEYLSGQDMIGIVTKLPPMTAAEQIKNVLSKINTYVPFLGIIIKNTAGLPQNELRESVSESSSAHNSISSLNYTEQKTEQMLAPAGLINFSKVFKKAKRFVGNWLIPAAPAKGPSYRNHREQRDAARPASREMSEAAPSPELGKVKSLHTARADSFLIKEKIFFKKKSGRLTGWLGKFGRALAEWIDPRRWPAATTGVKTWFKGLSRRNRWLFAVLGLLVIAFIGNMTLGSWNRNRAAQRQQFEAATTALDTKEDQIDSYLLYNDEASAARTLLEARALLDSLPREDESQQAEYARLSGRLQASEDKVQKIVRIGQAAQTNDLAGLGAENLVFTGGKLFAASKDTIYSLTPNSSSSTKAELADATALDRVSSNGANILYFWNTDKLIQYDSASGAATARTFADQARLAELTGAKVYNNNFYSIHKPSNQIIRYTRSGANFGNGSNWLSEAVDLRGATDLAIDGSIYILNEDGQVQKFNLGKPVEYSSTAIQPVMSGAKRVIAGTSHIYFFDPASKRLVVLEKSSGHLLNQYQVESPTDWRDFAVNESGRKAYILAGEAVYEVNLNQ